MAAWKNPRRQGIVSSSLKECKAKLTETGANHAHRAWGNEVCACVALTGCAEYSKPKPKRNARAPGGPSCRIHKTRANDNSVNYATRSSDTGT